MLLAEAGEEPSKLPTFDVHIFLCTSYLIESYKMHGTVVAFHGFWRPRILCHVICVLILILVAHIHTDVSTHPIKHGHTDTKITINNSAITKVHTNTGDLSLSHRPVTQAVFNPKGSS